MSLPAKITSLMHALATAVRPHPVDRDDTVEPLNTTLGRRVQDRGRAATARQTPPAAQTTPSKPKPKLQIHCPDPTAEDSLRDTHQDAAQRLARQENWAAVSKAIRHADSQRLLTPGSMSVAELMAYGARADVVMAVEHALLHGQPAQDAPLLRGIEALEHVLAEHKSDFVIACIVAQAHMDIGWAWRGNAWDSDVPAKNRAAFEAHFDRAAAILEPFRTNAQESALLAATLCSLMSGNTAPGRAVADQYEKLIDLNPGNPRPMRAMGNHLLPRWNGTYAELELEARRTAARTAAIWGAGAYTWVMFDAIAVDAGACACVDVPFFIDGLRDILERRRDAYTANLLAAYCANLKGPAHKVKGQQANSAADENRAEIAACTRWIVREHMTELHPMIWAHAAAGYDNTLRIKSPEKFAASGREDALRIIMGLFQRELSAGKCVVFTEQGPKAEPN